MSFHAGPYSPSLTCNSYSADVQPFLQIQCCRYPAETDKTRNPKLEMPGRPVVGAPTTPRETVHGKQLLQLAPSFRTPKMLQLLETVKGLRLMGTTA